MTMLKEFGPGRALRALAVAASVMAFVLSTGCAETMNREDFASGLKNKTEEQVLKYAGKPKSVNAERPDHPVWIYKDRTFDISTRKSDPQTTVVFSPGDDGKLHVVQVKFE
jgi:hypothetical protein